VDVFVLLNGVPFCKILFFIFSYSSATLIISFAPTRNKSMPLFEKLLDWAKVKISVLGTSRFHLWISFII
jgi:hypothetical protein